MTYWTDMHGMRERVPHVGDFAIWRGRQRRIRVRANGTAYIIHAGEVIELWES